MDALEKIEKYSMACGDILRHLIYTRQKNTLWGNQDDIYPEKDADSSKYYTDGESLDRMTIMSDYWENFSATHRADAPANNCR